MIAVTFRGAVSRRKVGCVLIASHVLVVVRQMSHPHTAGVHGTVELGPGLDAPAAAAAQSRMSQDTYDNRSSNTYAI